MKKSKKLKKFTHEERFGDSFVVRVTESRVDMETVNKMWKTVFTSQTKVYGNIVWLIVNKYLEDLHAIVVALYNCSRIALNAEMLKAVMAAMDKVSKKQAKEAAKKTPEEAAKKTPEGESEKEILNSERILHESIEEIANNANVQ